MVSPTGSSLTDLAAVATPAPVELEAEDPATSGQEIDHVRRVRRQILAHNAGRDVSEAAETPYYVDEDCDADIEELRRVRRQIRYLFGSAPLTVPAFVPAAQPAPTFAPADLSALKLPPNSARQHDDGPVAPAAPHVPDLPLTRETTAPRRPPRGQRSPSIRTRGHRTASPRRPTETVGGGGTATRIDGGGTSGRSGRRRTGRKRSSRLHWIRRTSGTSAIPGGQRVGSRARGRSRTRGSALARTTPATSPSMCRTRVQRSSARRSSAPRRSSGRSERAGIRRSCRSPVPQLPSSSFFVPRATVYTSNFPYTAYTFSDLASSMALAESRQTQFSLCSCTGTAEGRRGTAIYAAARQRVVDPAAQPSSSARRPAPEA